LAAANASTLPSAQTLELTKDLVSVSRALRGAIKWSALSAREVVGRAALKDGAGQGSNLSAHNARYLHLFDEFLAEEFSSRIEEKELFFPV
jgi:hypothetical protein